MSLPSPAPLSFFRSAGSARLYRMEAPGTAVEAFVATAPGTRAISNDPAVAGVDYTTRLRAVCADALRALAPDVPESDAVVVNILRGGLNFGLREALADAFGWNAHTTCFMSAQRARDAQDSEEDRYQMRKTYAAQRTEDYRSGTYPRGGGVVDPVPEDAPFFVKDYHDYYKTPRGYHPRSLNSNEGWNVTGTMSFLNQPLLAYAHEIRSAVLVIHGEKAHSRYFGEDAFQTLTGDNKELLIIPGAVHTDLYDRTDVIPFDKLAEFYNTYLK